MNKGTILKEVNEVFQNLSQQKEKLNNLLMSPVWEELIVEEMDQTIIAMQDLDKIIGDLMEIQFNVINAPSKPIPFKITGKDEFEKNVYCKGEACSSIGVKAIFQDNKDTIQSVLIQNYDSKSEVGLRIQFADKMDRIKRSQTIIIPPLKIIELKVHFPNITGYYKILSRFEKPE